VSEQKICPTCGTEYPLSERFCPRDGSALRASSGTADLLGQIIADRYHILKKLGEGGMGTVYLAEHVKMGRKSALKVMNPGMNTDADAIARFNREASNASRLSHPNICGIYDFGETPDGLIYLAMEFIEGESLTSLIEKTGSLPPARAGLIIHQTADALQIAHDAGIVHRDLKPDNIMIAKTREGGDLVKVVDFGIAKASSSEAQNVTRAGLVVGTPEYMSPEQLAADKLDGRSDLYSLGLVAFNCLTGKLPFPADTAQEAMIARLTEQPKTLAEIQPEIAWPEAVQATLDKALARDANDRYQNAAQFGREFAAAIADMPATQASEGATMVIGAMTAPSDAATKAIPATRVAGKTPAKAAPPPAVAPKKSLVPMLAGGGVLAAAAVVGYLMLNKPEPAPLVNDPAKVATAPESTGNAPAPAPTGATTPPATNPGTSTPPVNPPVVPPRTNPGTTPSNPGTSTPPAVNVAQVLTTWRTRLESIDMDADSSASVRLAQNSLREIEPMLPSLSGIQLDDATYVVMLAYHAVDDEPKACRASAAVKASRNLSGEQKTIADAVRAGRSCQ